MILPSLLSFTSRHLTIILEDEQFTFSPAQLWAHFFAVSIHLSFTFLLLLFPSNCVCKALIGNYLSMFNHSMYQNNAACIQIFFQLMLFK